MMLYVHGIYTLLAFLVRFYLYNAKLPGMHEPVHFSDTKCVLKMHYIMILHVTYSFHTNRYEKLLHVLL